MEVSEIKKNKIYVPPREATKILGVHERTLYLWEQKGWIDVIRSKGNRRYYNVNKYLEEKEKKMNFGSDLESESKFINDDDDDVMEENKLKLAYVRVSTRGQKSDLDRQSTFMQNKYPDHKIIRDIGSGMNFNKRGIRKIIKLAIAGKIEELVIAHKDRLTRFGYELIEDLIKDYSGGKIIIIDKEEEDLEPEQEVVKDLLQIMNIFVAKMNGLRRYKE